MRCDLQISLAVPSFEVPLKPTSKPLLRTSKRPVSKPLPWMKSQIAKALHGSISKGCGRKAFVSRLLKPEWHRVLVLSF